MADIIIDLAGIRLNAITAPIVTLPNGDTIPPDAPQLFRAVPFTKSGVRCNLCALHGLMCNPAGDWPALRRKYPRSVTDICVTGYMWEPVPAS